MIAKKYLIIVLIISAMFLISCNTDSGSQKNRYKYDSAIRVNQVGYNINKTKTAIVTNTNEEVFEVIDLNDNVVFIGELTSEEKCDISGDYVRVADFSNLKNIGEYRVRVNDIGESYVFNIGEDLYIDAFNSVLKSYYFQRCSYELKEEYAGKWARSAGHPDTNCIIDESTTGISGTLSSPGGWYDAGDYGKYMVNSGISVWTLLDLYELYPNLVGDELNIPESGNGKSDLLDEVKYQLDWMLTMQDEDGGVFFKIGSKQWSWEVMPKDDLFQRYVLGKSTTSTLNFAAVLARASRLYKGYDSSFADQCLSASKKAWEWAVENDNVTHPDTTIPGTGPYDDDKYEDEFLLAAAELLKSTELDLFKNYIERNMDEIVLKGKAWWREVETLTYLSLMNSDNLISENLKSNIKSAITSYADKIVSRYEESTFRVPFTVDDYTWGSYGNLANYLVILIHAYEETKEDIYKDVLIQSVDFFFGKNPTGFTAITGIGDNPPMNPHHRPSGADKVLDPVPGLVVGGSNKEQNDKDYVDYLYNDPGKSYMDVYASWASNENAINQNAPVAFVLGFINQYGL